jgi:predicted nucleic acid-binding Zn ribbon protein
MGLFGVVAHDAACRRVELALRMALGADPMRILRTTVGQNVLMVGSGWWREAYSRSGRRARSAASSSQPIVWMP